jgi:hypothetical protein
MQAKRTKILFCSKPIPLLGGFFVEPVKRRKNKFLTSMVLDSYRKALRLLMMKPAEKRLIFDLA